MFLFTAIRLDMRLNDQMTSNDLGIPWSLCSNSCTDVFQYFDPSGLTPKTASYGPPNKVGFRSERTGRRTSTPPGCSGWKTRPRRPKEPWPLPGRSIATTRSSAAAVRVWTEADRLSGDPTRSLRGKLPEVAKGEMYNIVPSYH